MSFVVTALASEVARDARSASRDEHGNVLSAEIQHAGGNPCRHCLRRADAGERLVLFSYSPFAVRNPYKEVGPVFVHADGCERYGDVGRLPADFLNRPLVLRGYDAEQRIVAVAVVADGRTEQRVEELLGEPEVAFVHARSFTHGCYLFRIDRA